MEFTPHNHGIRIMCNDQSLGAHLFNTTSLLFIGAFAVHHDDKSSPVHVELSIEFFRQSHITTAIAANRREVKRRFNRHTCLEFAEWCKSNSHSTGSAHEIEIANFVGWLDQAQLSTTLLAIFQLLPHVFLQVFVHLVH